MVWREPHLQQSPKGSVNLFSTGTTATVSLTGNDLSINFGPNGITSLLTETGVSGTGKPTTNFGDGWYALGIDPTGRQRPGLLADVLPVVGIATGDGAVTGPYTTAGTDAYNVYHAEGQSGTLLNADVDGSGAVNSKDLTYTVAAKGDAVGTTPPAELPAVPVVRRCRVAVPVNAVPVTQSEVQALVPEAIAAWQAAGLDAADVRQARERAGSGRQPGHEHPGPGSRRRDHDQPDRRGLQLVCERGSGSTQAFGLAGPDGELLAGPAARRRVKSIS